MAAALAVMLLAASSATLTGAAAARAATPQALVLADSVTVPGPPPASSNESLEQYEAEQDGFTVTSVTGAQWDAMNATQFAQYQVIIIGDPTCDQTGASFAAAVNDQSVWEPVVMNSGGNKVLIGTDPTFHYVGGHTAAAQLEANGIAYAGAVAGATGAYIDLSCGYQASPASTPVPLFDGLSIHGAGQFTVVGEGTLGACATGVNVVGRTSPTAGLTDGDLSNWNCSVHEAFQTFPSDYTPLALAPISSGFPDSYCADDVQTKALACGSPYIMVSGGGVVVKSEVTLTPPTQSLSVGGQASVVANMSTAKGPLSGASVVFNVDSGPDTGQTFTGMTDSSGNVTFAYTNGGSLGTDSISATATYTSTPNLTEKAIATVTWAPPPAPTSVTTLLSGGGMAGTSISVPVGTAVTDSAKLSGPNAAEATGTVAYKVYSDATCETLAASAGTVKVAGGVVPHSSAEILSKPGKYYWTAAYSGDPLNEPSASGCRTEVVTARNPAIDTVSAAQFRGAVTANVSTTVAGDLLVAFVAAKGPAAKHQSVTVSASGLKWTFAGRENAGRGDAEIWVARAAGTLHKLRVTATEKIRGLGLAITVVAFRNATGIGRTETSHASSGAPIGKLTTSKPNSWVFAAGVDWLNSALRTVGAGQVIISQSTDNGQHDTYWFQATKGVMPTAGTPVTINDTKPAKDPYDMDLVEIL
jgi:hypothetical protein